MLSERENRKDAEKHLQNLEISADEAKRAIAVYSSKVDEVLAYLYERFNQFRTQYWSQTELPEVVIAIKKLDRQLAHYSHQNEYYLPHALEFSEHFIALNWMDRSVVEAPDRTLVDHVLLHEMIHLYQSAVLKEEHKTPQAAHGRSFRKEAARLGLRGYGRLMICPYKVKSHLDGQEQGKHLKQTAQNQANRSISVHLAPSIQATFKRNQTRIHGLARQLSNLAEQQLVAVDPDEDRSRQFEYHLTQALELIGIHYFNQS